MKVLSDVNAVLLAALESNGYVETSYFAVPGGFALVTRLEQIDSGGVPKHPPARWSIGPPQVRTFSLGEYMRALLTGNPGYYRVLVFTVTPTPFTESDKKLTEEEARNWLVSGLNVLPNEIGSRAYTQNTACTVLIYEFERLENQTPHLLDPSPLDARSHLMNSGIWQGLQSVR
jgi:hypothetical protein